MTFKINSSAKHVCQRCKKAFSLHQGSYVNLNSPEPKFFCLRCLAIIERDEARKRDKISALAEEIRKEQREQGALRY